MVLRLYFQILLLLHCCNVAFAIVNIKCFSPILS